MKTLLSKKAFGFYLVILAALVGVVSLISYLVWASGKSSIDGIIVAGLVLGMLIDVVLIFKDNHYLMILSTICYSIPTVRLLTNSVGSFVDKFQGINMFGDASQVGTITTIAIIMFASVLLSILASFMKREKA